MLVRMCSVERKTCKTEGAEMHIIGSYFLSSNNGEKMPLAKHTLFL